MMSLFGLAIGTAIGSAIKATNTAAREASKKKSSSSSGSKSGSSGSSGGALSSVSSYGNYPAYIRNPDGSYQQGRIINGVTYQNNGSRMSEGQSVYDRESGEWTMQNGKGVRTGGIRYGGDPYEEAYYKWATSQNQMPQTAPDSYYGEEYDRHINDSYRRLQEQIEEQNRLAVQQGVNRLEANRGALNQGYDEAARQAYVAMMKAQKGLPQALAGHGITGGGTESARLALDTSYGDNINQNELARQNAMAGLDQAISDVKTSGDLNLVEQQLALQQQQLSDYQNAQYLKMQQENQLKQWQMQQRQEELEKIRTNVMANYGDITAYINQLLAQGYSPDSDEVRIAMAMREQKKLDMAARQAGLGY